MLKKLKEKIEKLILVSFVCFGISPVLFAYDEFTEKKYKTFDGKIFEIKENAILHEKVQKKVNVLMEAFKEDIKAIQRQKEYDGNNHLYLLGVDLYGLYKYEKYESCLYECIEKLEKKGIEIEIKFNKKSTEQKQ